MRGGDNEVDDDLTNMLDVASNVGGTRLPEIDGGTGAGPGVFQEGSSMGDTGTGCVPGAPCASCDDAECPINQGQAITMVQRGKLGAGKICIFCYILFMKLFPEWFAMGATGLVKWIEWAKANVRELRHYLPFVVQQKREGKSCGVHSGH